jgi:hypothetical protein
VDLSELQEGRLWPFADFAAAAVPRNIAGVYTIWDASTLVYVGIGGTQVRYAEPDDEAEPPKPVEGLRGRLAQHASGDRSGDKFCIYVCDRFVLRSLTSEQFEAVCEGKVSLDHLTRSWIRERYGFRYIETRGGGSQARRIENDVRRGVLDAGRPTLNAKLTARSNQTR